MTEAPAALAIAAAKPPVSWEIPLGWASLTPDCHRGPPAAYFEYGDVRKFYTVFALGCLDERLVGSVIEKMQSVWNCLRVSHDGLWVRAAPILSYASANDFDGVGKRPHEWIVRFRVAPVSGEFLPEWPIKPEGETAQMISHV